MKKLTKKELQLSLIEQVDDLFTAPDWDTFKSKLQHMMEQATIGNYDARTNTYTLERIHAGELSLLEHMANKYVHGQKVTTKKRTRDLKSDLAGTLQYSNLPGEAYRDDEFSSLIRYK